MHNTTTARSRRGVLLLTVSLVWALALAAPAAWAHPEMTGDPAHDGNQRHLLDGGAPDPSAPLEERDAETDDIVSTGPFAKVTKNLAVAGRGERLVEDATSDVWTHDGFAYLGTFNTPCGTGEGAGAGALSLVQGREKPGIPVFDVRNPSRPAYLGNIPSVAGSRINDVKVASMNGGDILVHSNEACAEDGPGGFEVYNVDDPRNPVHLAHVQVDDLNAAFRQDLGVVDVGVHNLFLFTRNGRDYVAAQAEGYFGSFQVFDITDPGNAELVSWFGAEYVLDPTVDWANESDVGRLIDVAVSYLLGGFGASQNRFLHDHYVTPDGQQAYLANWDAGLLLVDLGALDGSPATLVSQAIEPGSEDGEVNSHSVWPTADGRIVVEGEEDFAPFRTAFSITSGPDAGEYAASEGGFTTPVASLPEGTLSGPTRYVGLGCEEKSVPEATEGEIALVQRGGCRFDAKATNAIDAGYAGMVVFNDAARGDAVLTMGGAPRDIPGVFVGHSTGLKIAGVASADELEVGATGESVRITPEPDGWSGLRIWDYSDPSDPVLASTFNTACSADPLHESCDPRGTYSSHNVIVEGTKAYVSWYSEGVLVLDVSDPYNPVEVARYHESGPEFEARNGGIQDVWGVYKEPGRPWVYASDRNGGLYVLKAYGAGSAKQGKS